MKRLFPLLILLFLIAWPAAAVAADLTLGYWPASGQQGWHIAFPTTGGNGASALYYPQAGNYLTATYVNELSLGKKLRIEAGFAGMKAATGSDSDWDYGQKSDLWYYGEFKTGGSGAFVSIDWVRPGGGTSEYFLGYSYRRSSLPMTDGVYYTENYAAQNPPEVLSGLNSSYTSVYQGPHIGVSGASPMSANMKVVGSLTYSPLALYQGHGWWNLRGLDFEHTGTAQMADAYVGVRYAPAGMKNTAVNIGYRYQWMSVYHGWENTSTDIVLDKATNVQQGLYFSTEYRF